MWTISRSQGVILMAITILGLTQNQAAAAPGGSTQAAMVDAEGALRWEDTDEEVALFGVNYCVPFAYGYRALGYVGASREQTVDHDLAHLARMGLDGLRLCLWGDRELTDRQGNLVENDHLRLLDYVIWKARARGLYILLTPIVTYSAQWPEPEEDRPPQGFSDYYSKYDLATSPEARKAQRNYLAQLMRHVNPHTGIAYKDDPIIFAVELINEPVNPRTEEDTREYIDALAEAVRGAGCRKPLFYNISQSMWPGHVAALRDSTVEGCTFGWYPAGLLAGHSLRGNCLPKVDDYPQMRSPELAGKAKLVYEFDAADVPGCHMYPAMARTFRAGGAQFATMFSYDPALSEPGPYAQQSHQPVDRRGGVSEAAPGGELWELSGEHSLRPLPGELRGRPQRDGNGARVSLLQRYRD